MQKLLVIDDDRLILETFRFVFPEDQVSVLTAPTATEGLRLFDEGKPDVVVMDVRLPDMSGIDAFRQMHQRDPKVPVILMTGFGTAQTAIEAIRLGAFEYVLKPFVESEKIIAIMRHAFETRRLMSVPAVIPTEGRDADEDAERNPADVLIGQCPEMQEMYRAIGRVAPQDVTVLINGESGTGKEVVARAIYHYSRRAAGPFLAINCAAIPEALLESELFGHEKGAFTGAERQRVGKFEQCNGGTLFLDEIGDMTPLTQTKVLRALQDQQFERVGGNQTIHTNVRLIAATNRNLAQMIAVGQFRSDLYYRLNVYSINLPPLRERGDDISLLVAHFIRRFRHELERDVTAISREGLDVLRAYPWPGNIRELQSVLKHAMLQATGPVLVPAFFPAAIRMAQKGADVVPPPSLTTSGPLSDVLSVTRERLSAGSTNLFEEVIGLAERQLFTEVLKHTDGNLSQAARLLGINRATLRTKLAAYGLTAE